MALRYPIDSVYIGKELSFFELRIRSYIGDSRDGVAEHLAPVSLGKKFMLSNIRKKSKHRRFDCIDLGLCCSHYVEAVPINTS